MISLAITQNLAPKQTASSTPPYLHSTWCIWWIRPMAMESAAQLWESALGNSSQLIQGTVNMTHLKSPVISSFDWEKRASITIKTANKVWVNQSEMQPGLAFRVASQQAASEAKEQLRAQFNSGKVKWAWAETLARVGKMYLLAS